MLVLTTIPNPIHGHIGTGRRSWVSVTDRFDHRQFTAFACLDIHDIVIDVLLCGEDACKYL